MKVKLRKSLRMMVDRMVLVAIIITIVAMIVAILPSIQRTLRNTTQNEMLDMVQAKGEMLDRALDAASEDSDDESAVDTILGAQLEDMLKDVRVQGLSTSYAYAVDGSGTMLYHPTADKIGKPVENSVIKQVVADLEAGKTVKNQVVSYDFNGTQKYAGYYVSQTEGTPFILVISADESDVMKPVNQMMLNAIVIGIIIAFVMELLMIFLMKKQLKPVLTLTSSIKKMEDLDFTKDQGLVELTKQENEFGLMGKALLHLEATLSGALNDIKKQADILIQSSGQMTDNATTMSDTASQVDNAVSEIANGATSQAQSTQEASEAVASIGDQISDVRKSVDGLNQTSTAMANAGQTAGEILEELKSINQKTIETIQEISEQTKKTNASASDIRKAATLISGIASQTNLLSLNASIEAARAGEQGKGFAVVAEEIGKLADQSGEAAKEIEQMINQLVADSEASVETMAEVEEVTKTQSEDIQKTNDAFLKMKDGIFETTGNAKAIDEKATSMDTARKGITDTVESLSAIAEENAASTEQSSASVTQLAEYINKAHETANNVNRIAEDLKAVTGRFKTEG